jgi:hypothetical protein
MVSLGQTFLVLAPLLHSMNQRSWIPQNQSSESDTPEARYANQMIAERPPNVDMFRTAVYMRCILDNPDEPFKNLCLTSEQRNKITRILINKKLFDVPEVVNLRNKIKFYYQVSDILQKTYESNPSLDKKEFQNLSAKLDQYSIAALRECMHEKVGLKYLEQLALSYVELNVKEEWQTEAWWLAGSFKGAFSKKAWSEVSHVAREQFEKLACAFQNLGKKLYFQNDMGVQIDVIQESESKERSIQALKKAIEVYKIARKAMFKMPGIQEGLNCYRNL